MTQLEGFRCNGCGVETKDKQGTWIAVQIARVSHNMVSVGWTGRFGDQSHYCSQACLAAHMETWKDPTA